MRAFLLSYNSYIIITNLQQSRFLAMVSNYERLNELSEEAANSEDAALIQYLKTMDSIDAKLNQLKTTFQEFYTSTGVEELIKGAIDSITNIISRLNDMPKMFGSLPVAAIGVISKIVSGIKAAGNALGPQVIKWFTDIKSKVQPIGLDLGKEFGEQVARGIESKTQRIQGATENALKGKTSVTTNEVKKPLTRREKREISENSTTFGRVKDYIKNNKSSIADIAGTIATVIGTVLPKNLGAGTIDDAGTALAGFGASLSGIVRVLANPLDVSGWFALLNGIPTLIDGIIETSDERIERLERESEDLNNEALLKKNEYTTLQNSINKINELKQAQFDSAEAAEEYKEAMKSVADTNPELITGFDEMGNAIVDAAQAEEILIQARRDSYDATIEAAKKEIQLRKDQLQESKSQFQGSLPTVLSSKEGIDFAQEKITNAYSVDKENIEAILESYGLGYLINNNTLTKEKVENVFSGKDSIDKSSPAAAALKNYYNLIKDDDNRIKKQENDLFNEIAAIQNRAKTEEIPFEEYNSLVLKISDFLEENDSVAIQNYEVLKNVVDSWDSELIDEARQNQINQNLLKASEKRLVSSILGKNFEEDFISGSEELFLSLQDQIYENFLLSGENDFENYFDNNLNSINEIVAEYSSFWNNLGDQQQDFQNLLANSSNYTLDEYKTALQVFDLKEGNGLYSNLVGKAEQLNADAKTRYNERLGQFGDNIANNFGYLSEEIISGLLENVTSQIEQANRISPNVTDKLNNLYQTAINENFGSEAEKIITNADLFSLTGYIDMLQKLEEMGIEVEKILPSTESWFTDIPINLQSEFNTFGQSMSEKIKEMGDALDKATSGMDINEATSFAQMLEISISDLTYRDGKFFYDNLQGIKNHYLEAYDRLKESLNIETNAQIDQLTKYQASLGAIMDASNFDTLIKAFPEEIQSLYNTYIEDWRKSSDETKAKYDNSYINYIIDQINQLKAENENDLYQYVNDQTVRLGLANGIIYDSLEMLGLNEEQIDLLISSIYSGNLDNIQDKTWFKDIIGYIDLINSSVESGISDTWKLIAEGISSGNFIETKAGSIQAKFLSKISSLSGSFIEETGSGIFKVIQDESVLNEESIEKVLTEYEQDFSVIDYNDIYSSLFSAYQDRSGSKQALKEGLSTLIENADKIEREAIGEIATRFGITATELEKYLTDNSDGTFSATAEQIQALITDKNIVIDTELKDQLRERFDSIIAMISNAIGGSASYAEIETIQKTLNGFGAEIELKTFETSEGLELTEESAYEIYDVLSQIDSVAAQGVLTSIIEQMEEWEGRGVDIATIYGKIGEARKKIAELEKNPDDSRLKLAKAELSTLQEIAKEKAKDEDNFDFMNKDIGNLNNPLTFYDSSAKAFEALSEAASTGYMDIQAYVNMINFAADMYASAGQNFEVLGMSAAEAIEAGMAAIKGVDGEAKIDMSGLTFGVDQLTEGMEFGIEEMARSQIEWIDAQIAILKGVEAVQNIGELDSPKAATNISDFIDNYIGNFTTDDNYQGLKDRIEELQADATEWAKFCAQWQAILDKNDPATMEQEIIQLFSDFDINLSDYIIPESEYDLVYDKVAEIFDPKNLYKKVINADNAEETAEVLAKSLGLDKQTLLNNIKKAIGEDGITAEELISLIVENFQISQDEFGNLVTTIKINAKPGEKIEKEDLLTGEEVVEGNKRRARNRTLPSGETATIGNNNGKKNDANADVGTLNITAEKAVLSDKKGETTEETNEPITPEGITETAQAIKGDFVPATKNAGTTAEESAPKFDKARTALARLRSVAGNLGTSKLQSFANAVSNFNNGGVKLGILGSIVAQLNKLPTSPRYAQVSVAAATGTATKLNSLDARPKVEDFQGIAEYLQADAAWKKRNGISNVKGTALAAGTLMGELGPELVVSGGHYYVVGQAGAEFVNLPSDAIVFNHLQTKRLLENGHINSTGDPATNEHKAVAWATGNVDGGPAMASASASDVIAQLLQLRAFWTGILDMSAQDFAKAGGGGKGGGGGGGEDNKAYIADLERWYNLLRQIANLEQKVTLEQAKRANMVSGYDYVDSLEEELDYLKRQQKAYSDLAKLQKAYYDTRRQDLLNSDYSKIFTYTSDGLMQYHEGEGVGFDILAKLQETDANGQMKMNATQQLAYLQSVGFDTSVLKVTKEGEDVDSETEMVQNFFDNVQAWMDELDGLYDSYNDALVSVEEAITAQNEIEQQYVDNQLSLEQQVLTAIMDREQAAIDMAQEEIDAMQETADNFINGLNDTLKREQEMYQTNNEQAETERLQRQLAILQRSGGSASEIRALEEQLDSRYQDAYFDTMQDEINAIETASKNQIEKMQEQVDIATEALEYQKANGLLWNEVYEIMNNWNANAITNFVMEFTKAFQEQSALQNKEQAEQTLKESEIYKATPGRQQQSEMWQSYYKEATSKYGQNITTNGYSAAKDAYDSAYQSTQGTAQQKHMAGMAAANAVFEKTKAEYDKIVSGVAHGGNSGVISYPYGRASDLKGDYHPGTEREGVLAIKYALKQLGYYKGDLTSNKYYDATTEAVKAFQRANGLVADGIVGEETKKAFRLKGYKIGGLVDYTGLAMVHGTPQKPESYLNAEQTQQLRNLVDESKSLNGIYNTISNIDRLGKLWNTEFSNQIYSTNLGGSDMVFEDVDINISSGVINNQAEAAQLGRTMWNEFVNVARKTGNLTLSRR